jgi:hypothetical protein
MWNPPSLEGTYRIPGLNGGMNGAALHLIRLQKFMYVNGNESPWIVRMADINHLKKQKVFAQTWK